MARPKPGGWDFIKVGEEYQYKEDMLICTVLILEDRSDDESYCFKVKPLEANINIGHDSFVVGHAKMPGAYSGQAQFYERPEYFPVPWGASWKYNYREK